MSDFITETIVVPLDGSALADKAAGVASRLVTPEQGPVVLLSVGSDACASELRHHLSDVGAELRGTRVDTVVVPGWDAAKEDRRVRRNAGGHPCA